MSADIKFMQRCLQLAKLGLGYTAPNPLVGSVIIHKGQIIGEGYHHAAGMPHAEVEAVRSVKDRSLLRESTLYVNLEPCNHTGKTPPCTDLIIDSGIPKVVVSQADPNPLVAGTGLKRLVQNGVEVVRGILENESLELNRRFNTFHTKKRPYVILKWAQSADGLIDFLREDGQPANPVWITDEYCRTLVHKWRTEETAILVGTKTAQLDNPKLNVRAWKGRDPIRLVIDRYAKLEGSLNIFDGSQLTFLYTEKTEKHIKGAKTIRLNQEENTLVQIMNHLYQNEIQSVIVEGGAELLASFIQMNIWDEARVFTGPAIFKKGVGAPDFPYIPTQVIPTGNSQLSLFRNT